MLPTVKKKMEKEENKIYLVSTGICKFIYSVYLLISLKKQRMSEQTF